MNNLSSITSNSKDMSPVFFFSSKFIGSFFSNKHAGNFGIAGSFSFSMPKLITMGQGGAVVTSNSKLAKKLRYYKDFGRNKPGNDIHNHFGYNLKITDLQSILALGQLNNINYRINTKKKIYNIYYNLLDNEPRFFLLFIDV